MASTGDEAGCVFCDIAAVPGQVRHGLARPWPPLSRSPGDRAPIT